jgi:hypothetical protein
MILPSLIQILEAEVERTPHHLREENISEEILEARSLDVAAQD